MQSTDVPTRFTKVWGVNAGAGYIRTVPVNSQIGIQDGAASFNDGFVPDNFIAIAAGGVPPFGQDFNGLGRVMTQWEQWFQAGGPIVYNSAFSTAIGGYPAGAMISSAVTAGLFWVSTADNNTTDPDSGGAANWQAFSTLQIATALQTQQGLSNGLAISPKGLADAGFRYVVAESLIENNGYRVMSDGFIECWGFVSLPTNTRTTVGLPYAHTSWCNPVGSGTFNSTSADHLTGVISVNFAGGVPVSFTVLNAQNTGPCNFWWQTKGK